MLFPFVLTAQSLSTELTYLMLINGQNNKALIKDNLRNAEIMADTLFFFPRVSTKNGLLLPQDKIKLQKQHDSTASFFLKELGMSYFIVKDYPMALFTFLRQRYFYPNDTLNEIVSSYFVDAAAFANVKKDIAAFLLRKSDPGKLENIPFAKRRIMFLEKVIFLNLKALNAPVAKYVNYTRESNNNIPGFVEKWAFLTKIKIPASMMEGYMNYYKGNIDSLNFKLKKIMYRKATRYYLKNNAWIESEQYIDKFCLLPLKINNKITCCWFRMRKNLHL